MEAVSVQFALLAVTRGTASSEAADLATAGERATSGGHRVLAEQTVADNETAIRAQLETWIADPTIDVVLVLAGAESDSAGKALKPLITEVLPGFTDLFRWLMFQESGASAMLSSAEAAQCGSTIVFVLPGAIAPAMDKLILPQFDPKTTPRNLVEKLPRLRTEPGTADAIPQPVPIEKTQGGSGIGMRLPAIPSGRMRSRTGANVIHREQPTDDPTKPIDLSKLESELAASGRPSRSDDPTVTNQAPAPPRADTTSVTDADAYAPEPEDDHTDVTLAAPPPPALAPIPGAIPSLVKQSKSSRPNSPSKVPGSVKPVDPPRTMLARVTGNTASPVRAQAATPATPLPAVTIQPRGRKSDQPKPAEPSKWHGESGKSIDAQRAIDAERAAEARKRALTPRPSEAPKNVPKPEVLEEQATTRAPAVAPGYADEARTTRAPAPAKHAEPFPDEAATTRAHPANTNHHAGEAKTTKAEGVKLEAAKSLPKVAKADELPTSVALRQEDAKTSVLLRADEIKRPSGSDLDQAATVDGVKGVTKSAIDAMESVDAEELVDDDAPAEIRSELPKDVAPAPAPAPVPRKSEPTPPPPAPKARPATEPPPVAKPATRTPTAPPLAARDRSSGELPRGSFSYPVQRRKGSIVLKLFLFALVIGIGFGAVVVVAKLREDDGKKTETVANPNPSPTPDPNPTPNPTPDPSPNPTPNPTPTPTPGVEPDIEIDPTPPVVASNDPKPRDPKPKDLKPKDPKPPVGAGSGSGSATTPVTDPTTPPPDAAVAAAVDDDCDETSCILSKYDRACCAKYKPTSSDFKPRVGDTPESLDKSMVRAGVEIVKPRVVKCGEKSGAKGTVKIAMTVAPDGAVTSASVADAPEASLGDCVLAAMRSAKFGKTVNGATFTYPFKF